MQYNPFCFVFPLDYLQNAPFYPPLGFAERNTEASAIDLDGGLISRQNTPSTVHVNNAKQQHKVRVRKDPRLQQESSSLYIQERRNYRNRRSWLKKSYVCEFQKCNKKYSSNMALRNHTRDSHGVRIREKKPSQ